MRTRLQSILFGALGPLAAIPPSPPPRVVRSRPADHGGSRPGVRPPSLERDGGVSCAGVSGARVAAHHRPHSRAHSSPTMRACHAVMEPRPMIHGGKRASCRCFENPPGRSWYGWGPSCGGHSRVPFTTRREATKSLSGRGGGGGWSPSAAVSHRCAQAATLRGSRRSCSSRWLRSSHAKSPRRSMWWRKSSTEVPPGRS